MKSHFYFIAAVFVLAIMVFSKVNAQPTWELYENENCALSLKHPYKNDIILESASGIFQVNSNKDIQDPDSLNMNMTISCLDERLPITKQAMNLTLSGLKQDLELVMYEENLFNETLIDGVKASTVTAGGLIESSELLRAHTVTEMNHDNNTYIIRIISSGNDGISGFFNNHNYFKDNILNSIKFIN